MEKKFIVLLLTVMMVFSTFGFNTASYAIVGFANGSGTETDPWQIESAAQLNLVRSYLGPENRDKYFVLINDINLNVFPFNEGAGWEPIGNWWGGATLQDFQGTFDGGNHTISGLYINMPAPVERTDENAAGLFGEIYNATIRNVVLSEVRISGQDCVGGVVGCAEKSFISNVTVSGIIAGGDFLDSDWVVGEGDYIGGIAGFFYIGAITGVQGLATVAGSWRVGGLVGNMYQSTISNSFAQGSTTGDALVGGMVGENDRSIIINSSSTSLVNGFYDIGGLVGSNDDQSTIIYSHAEGTVSGTAGSYCIGGLAGENSGSSTISKSFATGDVSGDDVLGGLVGQNIGSNINNTYASGGIESIEYKLNPSVGGLVGSNDYDGMITTSYAVGVVSGSSMSAYGGLVGRSYTGGPIVSSYSLGPENGYGIVVTTGAMMMESTFTNWDFVNIWDINEGVYYPYLLESSTDFEIGAVTSLANINVGVGTALSYVPLPRIVQVSIEGTTFHAYLPVTWDSGTPTYGGSTSGDIIFTGTITTVEGIANTSGYKASIIVIVRDREITTNVTLSGINVTYGTILDWVELPSTIQATLDDGSTADLAVTWDGGDPVYDEYISGTYIFTGTITTVPAAGIMNNGGYTASVNVVVGSQDIEVLSVGSLTDINVVYGTPVSLIGFPTTVQAVLADFSTTDVAVTWDDGTPDYGGNASGIYVFKGNLILTPGIANGGAHTASVNVIVEIAIGPPTVTNQPTDCSVPLGETATFTVGYSSNPEPNIQWQLSTNNGKKWINILDATSATYSFPVTNTSMDGYIYRAILNNNIGSPVTTNIATLAVTYGVADVGISQSGIYDSNTNVITWTITAVNNGPDKAIGVNVRSTLINGTKFLNANTDFGYQLKGRTVIFNIGDLNVGEDTVMTIQTQVTRAVSPFGNTVTVTTTSLDEVTTNNTNTITVN